MLSFPQISPVFLSIGPIDIRWYGLMYLFGFLGAYLYCCQQGKSQSPTWDKEAVGDLIFYAAIGVILGGRIGFVLLYQPGWVLQDPFSLIQFWERGRSFHGGLLGVIVALWLYCRMNQRHFWDVTDFIAPTVPIGLGFGRLGNFINGELWGRVTDVSWGVIFPSGGPVPRHPSQLYELFLEGIVLFILLNHYRKKSLKRGFLTGLFLCLYGLFRCFIEFFRAPDSSHGFILFDWMTMGQMLSTPMILLGLWLMVRRVSIPKLKEKY